MLTFHDYTCTPKIIRNILEDYTIAKLQSGIAGDIRLLHEVGIAVSGAIESGTLFLMIDPGTVDEGFGAKHQIRAIWSEHSILDHFNYLCLELEVWA